MTGGTKAALILATVITIPLAIWGAIEGVKRDAVRSARLKISQDSLERVTKEKEQILAERDSIAREKQQVRIEYVDRLLPAGRTAPVPVDSARALVRACREEADSCRAARKAADSVNLTLRDRITNLEKQRGQEKPPRLGVTADGMWDVLEMVPAARVTALGRVGGPLSFFAELQVVARSNREIHATPGDSSRVRAQAFVGARLTFR